VQQLLQSQDWRQRHAALMAVSQIGESCKKQIIAEMTGIVGLVIPFFNDAHPRVAYAALQLVGVFCDDLAPDFQSGHHATVIPAVLGGLSSPHLRIKAQAAAVLVNFCTGMEDGCLDPYLEQVLSSLVPLLQISNRAVQEDAVTALANVAEHSKSLFHKYYASFMPGLKAIIANSNTKDSRMLRGKAIECMSLIGAAVGEGGHRELFKADSAELMQLVMGALSTNMEPDDPTHEFLLMAIPRVCQALKEDFVPYLAQVVPIFLNAVKGGQATDFFNLQDADEPGEDNAPGVMSQTVGIRGVGQKRINIHVEALTDKMRAAEILSCICANLEEHFFPFVDETLQAMMPLLDFPMEEIRHSTMKILPELMRSGVQYHARQGPQQRAHFGQATLRGMLPVILSALIKEGDTENVSMLLDNFAETIQLADQGALTDREVDAIIQVLMSILKDCRERQQEMIAAASDADADDKDAEDMEEELEVEFELQSGVGECLGSVIRSGKDQAVAPFDKHFKNVLGQMLSPQSRNEDRMMALCAFIDIVEHAGTHPTVLGYAAQSVPAMAAYTQDKDADLRQAAVYGLGIVAQASPASLAPHAADTVKAITALLQHPSAQEEENRGVTDNAVGALGKVMFYCGGSVDAAAVVPGWLQQLPLTKDRVEAKNMIVLLDKMITSQFAPLFADAPAAVQKILQVLVDGTTINEEGTQWMSAVTAKQAIAQTLQHLQATVPAEMLQGACASLPAEAQQALQAATA